MGNNTNTEELAASMAKANASAAQATQAAQAAQAAKAAIPVHAPISAPISAPQVYIQVHAPLVHAPPPHINIQPPPPSASQEQVAQYAELITTTVVGPSAVSNATNSNEQVLPALENEIRARVLVRAPQLGRALNPSIIQSIVNATKDDYLNNRRFHTPKFALDNVRFYLDLVIRREAPPIAQNFSNTTKLEPFWNVTQTQTEAVQNAECNNNTLPIGVYLSNNMSMYASIKY